MSHFKGDFFIFKAKKIQKLKIRKNPTCEKSQL